MMPISMLTLEPDFMQVWNDANNDAGEEFVHTIKVKVDGEKIALDGAPRTISSDLRHNFRQWDLLKEDVQTKDSSEGNTQTSVAAPHLWLTRADLVPESPNHTTYKWVLVTYVPETGVNPRSRMMYASARGIIRQKLGDETANLFAPDYHVTDVKELSELSYKSWLHHDSREAMSKREIELAEVEREVSKERASMPVRMPLMRVPFKLSSELETEVQSLVEAQKAYLDDDGQQQQEVVFPGFWIEISVDDETPGTSPMFGGSTCGVLVKKGDSASKEDFTKQVVSVTDEPRLYLVHLDVEDVHADQKGHVFLLYHCPSGSKPRDRMRYATAKKGLSDAVTNLGLRISKAVESSDEDSLTDAVDELVNYAQAPSQGSSSTAGTSASSSSEQSTEPVPNPASPSFRPPPGAFRLPGLP